MTSLLFQLFIGLAVAGRNIGINEDLPPAPINRSPQKSLRFQLIEIEDGLQPKYLIPIKYEKHGKNVCRGNFYDENGNVYYRAAAMTLLQREPASREAAVNSLDMLDTAFALQSLGASTIPIFGIGIPIYAVGWVLYGKALPDCKQAFLDYNSRN